MQITYPHTQCSQNLHFLSIIYMHINLLINNSHLPQYTRTVISSYIVQHDLKCIEILL
jgi:hypothetical protein